MSDTELSTAREKCEERLCIVPDRGNGVVEKVYRSRTNGLLMAKVIFDTGQVHYVPLVECNLSGTR